MSMPVRPGEEAARPAMAQPLPAQSLRAQLVLAGAMALWGLNIPAVRVLAGRFDPVTLAGLRMFCACCVFAVIALRWGGRLPRLERRNWGALLSCSVLMV